MVLAAIHLRLDNLGRSVGWARRPDQYLIDKAASDQPLPWQGKLKQQEAAGGK